MAPDRISLAGKEQRSDGHVGPASRRTLLKGMSVAGLAASSVTLAAVPAQAEPPKTGKQGLNYRETDHIKKYYDLARS